MEKKIHEKLKEFRICGEWYAITPALMGKIEEFGLVPIPWSQVKRCGGVSPKDRDKADHASDTTVKELTYEPID